ncbi:unnamed protein product [Durusdinium trenchii]|uniref:Uncharacterized protein n=2 Tax=Durusdinium trenchii TaxID=1381693 RepID=A0ABP0QK56_9DINO
MRIIVPEAEAARCGCGAHSCEACHGQKVIGSLMGQLEASPPVNAGEQLLAMLQPVQTAWVWPGDQTSFYSDYSDYSLEPWSECGASSPSQWGDETLIGPDGAVYDVFYPSAAHDEKEETSTTCSDCAGGSPIPFSRQRSAEASIEGVLDFMRSATMARYPARVQLYDKVCGAAKSALGDHFARMALIGSTALRIDTPDSDLDVVVYTRTGNDQEGEERLEPVEALRKITDFLKKEEALKLQLVDCARVPVLTVLSEDGRLSLDLTVDQPLGEWHVLWFQSLWQWDPFAYPLETLPPPIGEDKEHWSAGLEATALRCIKWWLRRRSIPVSKEGGYPTVVWTLMVLHVLRCSVFVNEDGKQEKGNRALLGAIAAFFDRFAGSGLMGTLSFSMGPDGVSTAFHPLPEENGMQAAVDYTSETPSFSVLDPTTTCELSVACGVVPSELAPALPPATRLLHAYELQRAQRLSALALESDGESSRGAGSEALEELFTETSQSCNSMPAEMPSQSTGVIVLRDGELSVGILTQVSPKHGWTAPFLHRRDAQSSLALQLCQVRECDGLLTPHTGKERWFQACEVVCLAALQPMVTRGQCRGKYLRRERNRWKLDPEGMERWHHMHALLQPAP